VRKFRPEQPLHALKHGNSETQALERVLSQVKASHAKGAEAFDPEFCEGAARVWRETGKPIAQVARDLGINEGTLGNWIARDQAARDGSDSLSRDFAELKPLRAEVAELRMERLVLKRSVVVWVKEATK
jgi:transposase